MNQPVQKGSLWNTSSRDPNDPFMQRMSTDDLFAMLEQYKDNPYDMPTLSSRNTESLYQVRSVSDDGRRTTYESSALGKEFWNLRRQYKQAYDDAQAGVQEPVDSSEQDMGMQPPESDAPWRENLGPAPAPTEMPPELQSPYEAAGEQYMKLDFDSSWAKDLTGGMEELAHAMGKSRSRGSRRFGMERQYPDVPGLGTRAEDKPVMTMPQTSRPGSLM